MPIYRVTVERTMEGRPGEVFIEADDVADARSIAASRHYKSKTVSLVEDHESIDSSQIIRRPKLETNQQPRQGTPVVNIAFGVFFGMLMFYFFTSFVSCATSH